MSDSTAPELSGESREDMAAVSSHQSGKHGATVLLLLLLPMACADPEFDAFEEAQEVGTIHALEDFQLQFPRNADAASAFDRDPERRTAYAEMHVQVEHELERLYLEEARSLDTIEAWAQFAVRFPRNPEYKQAILSLSRDPLYAAVSTVAVDVQESVDTPYSPEYREQVLSFMRTAGVVETTVSEADLAIQVVASGQSTPAYYRPTIVSTNRAYPLGPSYFGGSVDGKITVRLFGETIFDESFSGNRESPESILELFQADVTPARLRARVAQREAAAAEAAFLAGEGNFCPTFRGWYLSAFGSFAGIFSSGDNRCGLRLADEVLRPGPDLGEWLSTVENEWAITIAAYGLACPGLDPPTGRESISREQAVNSLVAIVSSYPDFPNDFRLDCLRRLDAEAADRLVAERRALLHPALSDHDFDKRR